MTIAELSKIINDIDTDYSGDNIFKGLLIINKYFDVEKKDIIGAVGHDIIYSVDADELLNAGLTEVDAISLAKLGWMVSEECLSCFV